MTTFPQLRIRTEFSFRNAFGPIALVAERLAEAGVKTAGIVDPSTWGHVRFEKALTKAGIQPAFGCEAKIEVGERRPVAWFLAESLPEFYTFSSARPTTEEAFANADKGIIRFCGAALTDPAAFDYVDLNPSSIRRARGAFELSRATGRPLILTSDNSYPAPADRDRFLAIVDGKKVTPQHTLFEKADLRAAFFFLSDEEFAAAYKATFEVAERLQGIKLRQADIISVPGDLGALVEAGRLYRIEQGHIPTWGKLYQQRLERELEMIRQKAFESYFIVVADLVCWAKERMLVGPARGSSAGSLVCYLLRITEVDPLIHGLLFERFIDINRNDLPDIDIDFNDQKRELCFDYLEEKYGRANVARIGNINTLKPRSVMAEVGKRMGVPIAATFAVRNVLIEYSSGDSRYGKGLEDTMNNTQPGQTFAAQYPEALVMGDVENHAWHAGVHAAGIIVSNDPVTSYCTVIDGVAQIDKPDSEYLNLLKIDALGLRTLGIIEDSGCVTPEQLYALKFDDPAVFDIINQQKFSGVFQFEGAAQRRVSMQVKVDEFKKIDHVTALARPGPLGGGAANHYINRCAQREVTSYRHPSMAEYLGETYGVVLYQEQVMSIVREIGKFSWEETSVIRKAMSGRKGKEFFDKRGEMFAEGAMSQGISKENALDIWNEICSFGAWGMNKSVCADTRVKLAHPNQFLGTDPTIEEVYNYYKVDPSPWIRQRKAMPIMLMVGDDGVARPTTALDLTYNGVKNCVELEFDGGRNVRCSRDHKFVINGEWRPCKEAAIGDIFDSCARDRSSKNHSWARGWAKDSGAKLISVKDVGEQKTYDVHMPDPHHNYILANGIVTHNSHTCSYAMISYYCCYMKTYHPLEYAAACLRNAKDDEQVVEILRELSAEGVEFTPFDPLLSEANWVAKEGKLLGGYRNVIGIGPVKANNLIAKRNAGKLTEKEIEKLRAMSVRNSELRPAHVKFGAMYAAPQDYNVHGRIKEFANLEDGENAVVICKLIRKERRDENETVRLARRNGERKEGQTQFIDAFVVDDSVSKPIVLRVRPKMWRVCGEMLADRAIDNQDWFLVRGRWLAQFSMMVVEKMKCLTNEELFNAQA